VDIVSSKEGTLELVQDELQNLFVRSLRVVLARLDLGGDEAQVARDKLGRRGWLVILCELICGFRERCEELVLELGSVEVKVRRDEEGVFEGAMGESQRAERGGGSRCRDARLWAC
jgi:hypothetical protein